MNTSIQCAGTTRNGRRVRVAPNTVDSHSAYLFQVHYDDFHILYDNIIFIVFWYCKRKDCGNSRRILEQFQGLSEITNLKSLEWVVSYRMPIGQEGKKDGLVGNISVFLFLTSLLKTITDL